MSGDLLYPDDVRSLRRRDQLRQGACNALALGFRIGCVALDEQDPEVPVADLGHPHLDPS